MTLQIGMMGQDGYVVVGDTWKFMAAHRRAWFGYCGTKMTLSKSGHTLAVLARNVDIGSNFAEEIFTQLEGKSGIYVDQILEIGSKIGSEHEVECFLGFTSPSPDLYFFQKGKDTPLRCELMCGCYPIGDAGNPAYYWPLRYYDRGLPVGELARIGALAVVAGAKLNNTMINGLEVATFNAQGLRIWNEAENNALRSEVDNIEAKIQELIPHR